MKVETQISYGYRPLIETFFIANNLVVRIEDKSAYPFGKITLEYDDDSETALDITFMSVKHLGLENMLCDYLIKCNIPVSLISVGQQVVKRDIAELDKQWEEHRKLVGFK